MPTIGDTFPIKSESLPAIVDPMLVSFLFSPAILPGKVRVEDLSDFTLIGFDDANIRISLQSEYIIIDMSMAYIFTFIHMGHKTKYMYDSTFFNC